MSKLDETWKWLSEWVIKKIRSPFSNFATKFTLILGSTIVASPLFEHLVFNAILKHWLDIDLGIQVPDTEAYIFGTVLVSISLLHNLVFIKLTNSYQIKIKDARGSVYRSVWESLDNVIDDTARLIHLFCKTYHESFDELTTKAEESVIYSSSILRKNRPFFLSDELYDKCSEINTICYRVIQDYRACLQSQKYRDGVITPEQINDISMENMYKNYNFYESQKFTKGVFTEAHKNYEDVCSEIRKCVNAI